MLDLNRLVPQIQEMTRGTSHAGDELRRRLECARAQLARVAADAEWCAVLTSGHVEPRMALPAAEPIDFTAPAPPPPLPLSVVAVDGSQVAPDPHEVAACCLINVGSVRFRYLLSPQAGEAAFASEPRLIYQREDADGPPPIDELSGEMGDLRLEVWGTGDLDARRTIAESERLAALMREVSGRAGEAGLGMLDGPLIAWPLALLEPRPLRDAAIARFLQALDVAMELQFPVTGYISRTRSGDLVRMLKYTFCETARETGSPCAACRSALRSRWETSDGATTPGAQTPGGGGALTPDGRTPARSACFAAIEGLLDVQLMQQMLPERGWRSAVFESNNRVLKEHYARHRRVGFFFLNTGMEIARVEVPEWVWKDPERLAQVHGAVYGQVRLGLGYPIALSEAHEQAVVRAPERQAFFELLRRTLERDRLPAEISAKALRKRGPIA
jgi:hypothetical protein